MIIEAVREWNEEEIVEVTDAPIDHKNMLVLAVATSIDALAVGITFAFLNTPIIEAISIIGITTFVLSIIGVIVGNFFGSKYKSKAEFIGGLILVLLGISEFLLFSINIPHISPCGIWGIFFSKSTLTFNEKSLTI